MIAVKILMSVSPCSSGDQPTSHTCTGSLIRANQYEMFCHLY